MVDPAHLRDLKLRADESGDEGTSAGSDRARRMRDGHRAA